MNEGFSELNLTVCPLAAHEEARLWCLSLPSLAHMELAVLSSFLFATLTKPLLYARNHVHYFPYFISYERKYGIFMSIL